MNVLLINGSPDAKGCISTAFGIMEEEFAREGIETTQLNVGNSAIRGCIGCRSCRKTGKCVFDDQVNEAAALFEAADGVVLGSPVYYSQANGTLANFMQRLLFSTGFPKAMKVGASVVSCRRGGNSATFEQLNQFFGIVGMPIAGSTYWNDLHGNNGEEVLADAEGIQTMRNLASSMSFLMRAIAAERESSGLPEFSRVDSTSFIR